MNAIIKFTGKIAQLSVVILVLCICFDGAKKEKSMYSTQELEYETWRQPIPAGVDNYRSAQPSLDELDELLYSGTIRTVLRLNGDGKDAGGVGVDQEKELCKQYGVRFVYLNIDGGDPTISAAQRLAEQLTTAARYLDQGRTLVHCRHGYDRTGAVVGYWLRRQGLTQQAVIEHNGWARYLEKKGVPYRKYFNAIQ